MYFIIEPADPDCAKCGGTGTVYEHKDYVQYPGCLDLRMGSSSIGSCDCRKFENRKKVQDRCHHEFVCTKCQLERFGKDDNNKDW